MKLVYTVCFCWVVLVLGFCFYLWTASRPAEVFKPINYEDVGWCIWDRFDPSMLTKYMTRVVRFCYELDPYQGR